MAHENGLIFIYHKHLSNKINHLNKETQDYKFLKEIGEMDEWEFYDKLNSLIFDYYYSEDVYIVRRYDKKHLISWVYQSHKSNHFPFFAFQPLNSINVGTHSILKTPHKLPYVERRNLQHPSTHPNLFFSVDYKCENCGYRNEISIAKDCNFFEVSHVNKVCNFCNQEKELVIDGEFIFRKDWPNPDDDPWQTQLAYLSEGRGYCKDCESQHKADYRDLRPACAHCNFDMVYLDENYTRNMNKKN